MMHGTSREPEVKVKKTSGLQEKERRIRNIIKMLNSLFNQYTQQIRELNEKN